MFLTLERPEIIAHLVVVSKAIKAQQFGNSDSNNSFLLNLFQDCIRDSSLVLLSKVAEIAAQIVAALKVACERALTVHEKWWPQFPTTVLVIAVLPWLLLREFVCRFLLLAAKQQIPSAPYTAQRTRLRQE